MREGLNWPKFVGGVKTLKLILKPSPRLHPVGGPDGISSKK